MKYLFMRNFNYSRTKFNVIFCGTSKVHPGKQLCVTHCLIITDENQYNAEPALC